MSDFTERAREMLHPLISHPFGADHYPGAVAEVAALLSREAAMREALVQINDRASHASSSFGGSAGLKNDTLIRIEEIATAALAPAPSQPGEAPAPQPTEAAHPYSDEWLIQRAAKAQSYTRAEIEGCQPPAEREAPAVPVAEKWCLFCSKDTHRTDECWSTQGMNTPQDRELMRLANAASALTAAREAGRLEMREAWERGLKQTWQMIDPTNPRDAARDADPDPSIGHGAPAVPAALTDEQIERCWQEAAAEADAPESEWLLYGQKVAAAAREAGRLEMREEAARWRKFLGAFEVSLSIMKNGNGMPASTRAEIEAWIDAMPDPATTIRALPVKDGGHG